MRRLLLIILAGMSVVACMAWAHNRAVKPNKKKVVLDESVHQMRGGTNDYERGVNDALDTAGLLFLELALKGKQMEWGDMAVVVRHRLGVKQPKLIKVYTIKEVEVEE